LQEEAAMTAKTLGTRWSIDRALRSICRCDGLKDLAVVAALLVISGAFAIRVASTSPGVTSFL
jgi:hypothetical protein